MTGAQALAQVEARLSLLKHDPELAKALEILRARVTPKPRKSAAGAKCPVAARALKALGASSGDAAYAAMPLRASRVSGHVNQEALYLDTFGPVGSSERAAQEVRLRALPVYAQFAYEGMPAKFRKDPRAGRMFLGARMAQFEVDDELHAAQLRRQAEREFDRRRRERVAREVDTLRRWATGAARDLKRAA